VSVDRLGGVSGAGLRSIAIVSVIAALGACSAPAASPSTSPARSVPPVASTVPTTPRPTEPPIAANPDGCPAPTESLSPFEFIRYGDTCFPSGATIEGWWVKGADAVVTVGQRPGSVDARVRNMSGVSVKLGAGQTVPTDAGYGRFSSPSATPESAAIEDATYTPLVSPAATCPTTDPIPVGVFLETLGDCYRPRADITIAGWRDTLDGLCGCGAFWIEKPAWLTSEEGIGWLFAEPSDINLDDYLTLYAPDADALGADSGLRPTYMEVTGHFDDPAAATCRAIANPDIDPSLTLDEAGEKRVTAALKVTCANRFVVTAVRELVPPPSALAFCPAGDPIPAGAIYDSRASWRLLEHVCFRGGDFAMVGWFDPAVDTNGESRTISPEWLDPYGRPMLWVREGGSWETGGFRVFVDPAHDVALPTSAGWSTMTGHFDDPAAAACVRTDGLNAGMSAVDDCRSQFVVTGVAPGQG
jgi:hypothetical protein